MAVNQGALYFKPPELLIQRFCREHGVPETEARERFEETKKFLYLCATNKGSRYSPSKMIDEMWHQFILHSRSYFEFCAGLETLFLHHVPSEKPETEAYKKTLEDMKAFYGELNPVYWAGGQASSSCCGDCSSDCRN